MGSPLNTVPGSARAPEQGGSASRRRIGRSVATPRAIARTLVPLVAGGAALLAVLGFTLASGDGETTRTASASAASEHRSVGAAPLRGKVARVDRAWHCRGPVDLDLVKVTMRTIIGRPRDAVFFDRGCTGRIDRIEIDTWQADGVKVRYGAQDIDVGSGYIRCHGRELEVHQDGVQAMSGSRILFNDLEIDCPTANNAAFFVSGRPGLPPEVTPTDVVCDGCFLFPANSTVNLKISVRSGVRNSTVCEGRFAGIRIQRGAVSPVNSGNVLLPEHAARCA